MSEITDIKDVKGKQKRQHIYIDNQYVCTLDAFTVYKNRLKIGDEITKEQLDIVACESEASSAFERAVDILSSTFKTRHQMRDYLKQKGYMPKTISQVIDKLMEYKYLDDERFVDMYISTYQNSQGKQKMRMMLLNKGVNKELIEDKLAQLEPQTDVIYKYASKFMQSKEATPQNIQKLCRHLANKGFSWAEMSPVISKFKSGEDYESWD